MYKTKLINLTDHTINPPGMRIPPSGAVARCEVDERHVGQVGAVKLLTRKYQQPENVPAPAPGVIYIVSAVVRLQMPNRTDVASPGRKICDDSGRVLGVTDLVLNPQRSSR